jgi:hypothetical protein
MLDLAGDYEAWNIHSIFWVSVYYNDFSRSRVGTAHELTHTEQQF